VTPVTPPEPALVAVAAVPPSEFTPSLAPPLFAELLFAELLFAEPPVFAEPPLEPFRPASLVEFVPPPQATVIASSNGTLIQCLLALIMSLMLSSLRQFEF
jgi:hypothetical protein